MPRREKEEYQFRSWLSLQETVCFRMCPHCVVRFGESRTPGCLNHEKQLQVYQLHLYSSIGSFASSY